MARYGRTYVNPILLRAKAAVPQVVVVGQASELDHANPVAARKLAAVGVAAELDSANNMASRKIVSVGVAAELDSAEIITAIKAVDVVEAAELDSANNVDALKRAAVGRASELDNADTISGRRIIAVGVAAELDSANDVVSSVRVAVGRASELDSANPVADASGVTVGRASELDSANPVRARVSVLVGQASELDNANPVGHHTRATVGQAAERDSATRVGGVHTTDVGMASELDNANPVPPADEKIIGVGVASELDSANFVLPVPTPGIPRLAHLLWAIAKQLRDCLCSKLADTLAGPVCRCSLMSGDQAIADICEGEPGVGEGQAWVRMTRLFASTNFPRPNNDTFNCAGSFWAAEFEIGVLRCAVTSDDDGQPPTADELNAETAKVFDDAFVLRWVTECCLPSTLPVVSSDWQPMSGGKCTGGRLTLTVHLVPGPHSMVIAPNQYGI